MGAGRRRRTTASRAGAVLLDVPAMSDARTPEPWLGAMNFGGATDAREAARIVARALEAGVRHVDTANAYTGGASERIVGELLAGHPEVAVATKVGFARVARPGGGTAPEGLAPAAIRDALAASLERLRRDRVDLYYLHVPDHGTPVEASLDALAEAYEAKRIAAWGVSNYAAWQVLEMIPLAAARGLPPPFVAQQLYNALHRELEVEWLPFARRHGVRTAVYNPLAGGLLAGKHRRDGSTQKGSRFDKNAMYQRRYFTEPMHDRVEALAGVAESHGTDLVRLSYGWLAARPGVDAVLVGPRTLEHLDAALAALAAPASPELVRDVDAAFVAWQGTDAHYVR